MRRQAWWGLVVLLGGLVVFQVVVWMNFVNDQRYLSHLMNSIASPTLPPSAQALALVRYLRELPPQTNRHYFLNSAFAFLRPTASEVVAYGGNCADRSRFVVVMLELHGIHASKWALYSPDLRPVHAVVEVESEQGKMVVDPLYGLWFPRPQGAYYGIRDLRDNPAILTARLLELRTSHERPGSIDLLEYPLNRYVYSHSRTINWDKYVATRAIYRFLLTILGEKVDFITRPEWAEQPAMMLMLLTCLLEAVVLLGFAVFVFMRNRRNLPSLDQKNMACHTADKPFAI